MLSPGLSRKAGPGTPLSFRSHVRDSGTAAPSSESTLSQCSSTTLTCCLSEEINGCLTTLVAAKDNTKLCTNIGIWLRDRSPACNYISAFLPALSWIVSMAAVFHPALNAIWGLEEQLQHCPNRRTENFIADPTFGWCMTSACLSYLFLSLAFPTCKNEITTRISSVKRTERRTGGKPRVREHHKGELCAIN